MVIYEEVELSCWNEESEILFRRRKVIMVVVRKE